MEHMKSLDEYRSMVPNEVNSRFRLHILVYEARNEAKQKAVH